MALNKNLGVTEPVQHHLQTVLDSLLRQGTKSGYVACISQEFFELQASTNFASYDLVDEHMPMAWLQYYPTGS
jgi:hypothetical protein